MLYVFKVALSVVQSFFLGLSHLHKSTATNSFSTSGLYRLGVSQFIQVCRYRIFHYVMASSWGFYHFQRFPLSNISLCYGIFFGGFSHFQRFLLSNISLCYGIFFGGFLIFRGSRYQIFHYVIASSSGVFPFSEVPVIKYFTML
jgi:hypothetical protein